MTTVIVPAHNEASVIARTLRALLDANVDDVEIIVVCNGCTDRTADIVRSFEPRITLIETPLASKPHALNLGDRAAHSFPRFYVDGDIVPGPSVLHAVADALSQPHVLAAAPGLRPVTTRSSLLVRAYCAIWQRLPQVRTALGGRGVYALSEAGRARFDEFPDVLNDDGFVSALFSDGTSHVVPSVAIEVGMPGTIRDLVRRRTRVVRGNAQLRALGFGGARARSRSVPGWARVVVERPSLLPALTVFLPVSAYVRVRGLVLDHRGAAADWGRDDSSRRPDSTSLERA